MGQLPSDWKLTNANIVPVQENYRRISFMSLVMKVMEKYVRDEIYSKCWYLINEKQHGFLPQKSCTTQFVTVLLLDDISPSINLRNAVDVIYFNFEKGFDTLCHDTILRKSKHIYKIDAKLYKELFARPATQRNFL